jgi:type I restriction-modification system DNA methylase subunit
MPLFQSSVLNKYLSEQDKELVEKQYTEFKDYFFNPAIQKNIIASKEEEFQEGFLRELFVNILGYTINPNPDYNLRTELKNIKDSKKADGAIIDNEKVLAVIELKGTNTINLNQIEAQAFGYKNNQEGCRYIITSNFKKIRFYIDNAIEFLEWDLFTLDVEGFKLLFLCLQKDNLFKNIPATIKSESFTVEDNVTKKLYKEYSHFRKSLFNNIVEHNPSTDKLLLFKKTQKLLDRFLFLFFAEDRMLVPPNSVRVILDQWTTLKDMDAYQPLYDRFKLYFGYLNTGHKGKVHDIFAYNGGLFASDEILDNVKMDDGVLYDATLSLSKYDYNSEVDVNILGHIFEHSLTEIEELEQEITSIVIGGSERISKRKKDGVFYTPKYITKYIVENTVGTLCKNKKEELKLQEQDYHLLTKKAKKQLFDTLQTYKNWLLQITIIDPACGSGAFLNQALEYLINEHKWISELEANITGSSIVFDVESSILENNIFGVDINEESVDIAKLSLWLRTASKGRKLNSLNNNIKCGNSLIDDVNVAGDKAFNWQNEFPNIFDKGGFDVVIGNPPYVRQELFKSDSTYLEATFKSYSGKADLFVYFYEKGINILKENGYLSFISSGKFFEASYGTPLISFLVTNVRIIEIIDFKDIEVFEGISAYPLIFICQKKIIPNYDFNYQDATNLKFTNKSDILDLLKPSSININDYKKNKFQFVANDISDLIEKLYKNSVSLKSLNLLPTVGVKTGFNEGFFTDLQNDSHCKEYIFGRNIKRYEPVISNTKIIFPYTFINNSYNLIEEENPIVQTLLPQISSLKKRAIIKEGILTGNKKWFEFQQINKSLNFENEYIIYPNVSFGNNFSLSKGKIIDMTGFIILSNDKSILAILNSRITKFLMNIWCISRRGGYLEYKVQYLEKLPIKQFDGRQKIKIENLVEKIISLNILLKNCLSQFHKLICSQYKNLNINTKIEIWYTLSFADFNKELIKQKVKLTLSEQSEWLTFFEQEKHKALGVKNEIDRTDKEIDTMVYELYGLTEEEIKIVEG